jgi:hypothetical protein
LRLEPLDPEGVHLGFKLVGYAGVGFDLLDALGL